MYETNRVIEQPLWAQSPIRHRLRVIASARQHLAANAESVVRTMQQDFPKTSADILTAELLPLLAAMLFLERQAESILRPRKLGLRGLPFWLTGIHTEVHRVPFGKILVIGPSNYPLLLPGIQAAQALAAGNSVIWKPGRGGRAIALAFADALQRAGLPEGLLRVTEDTVQAAEQEIDAGVDKVIFTGSVASGRALMRKLAETLTPSVMELSGCDPVIILPGADLQRVVGAILFGVRLNQSATCMAPRRLLLIGADRERKARLIELLQRELKTIAPVSLAAHVTERLDHLLEEAQAAGASICRETQAEGVTPVLVLDGLPAMQIAQEDIFAPVLTLIELQSVEEVVAAQKICLFGLSASLFGDEQECRRLAARLDVGTVFINDVIVPTADPRLPFGGRRHSGFGVTQGAEGLLELTAIKTIAARRIHSKWQYEHMTDAHATFFESFIRATYAGGLRNRMRAVQQTMRNGRKLLP